MGIYSPTVTTLAQYGVEVSSSSTYDEVQQSIGQGYIYSVKRLTIIAQTTAQLLQTKEFIEYDRLGGVKSKPVWNPANPEQKLATITQVFPEPFNLAGDCAVYMGIDAGEDVVNIFYCDEVKNADDLTRSTSLVDEIVGDEHFPMFTGFTDDPLDWSIIENDETD